MTNADIAAVLEKIDSGPSGPSVGALFDLDGTIVPGFTAAAFYEHRLRKGDVRPSDLARTLVLAADTKLGGDQGRLGDVSVAGLAGQVEEDLVELGERLFVQRIGATIRPQARELIRAHQRMRHTVAIASSATHFQVDPVARDLGVAHVLCSQVETENGLLTGRLAGGMLWGEAKARAAREFSRAHAVDPACSYAYGNGAEDVPFLSSFGHPHAVTPHSGLLRVAERLGWPVLALDDPGHVGVRSILGTVGALGALNLGLAIGLGVGLLRGDRRLGADLACALGFEAFLSVAGVKLNVTGASNIWAERPAVFVMNHQSGLDAMIVGALLHRGFSGLGKAEAKHSPATFLLGRATEAVFVDRSNSTAGLAGQDMLVERLRSGLSVFVAPEGTRSATPVLGTFKTGAFHVAMKAGVPIVPVILRNSYDLMPGSAKTIKPGVVDVAVLEPVSTKGWTADAIRAHVADVRQQFVQTLENWPGDAR